MRRTVFSLLAVLFGFSFSYAQWTTNGSNIYNNNGGNVGIGTTNPLFLLHLQSSAPVINFTKTGILNWRIGNVTDNNFTITPDSYTGSVFKITSDGKVGINTTNPGTLFHIASDANTSGAPDNSQFFITGSASSGKRLSLAYNTSSNYGEIQAQAFSGSYSPLNLNPNGGNVGIGTANPAAKLDIANILSGPHSVNQTLLRTMDGYNSGANGQFFQIIGAGDGTNYTNINLISNYGYLSFGARADASATPTNSLNILSNGNVGIGTTGPNFKFDVENASAAATIGLGSGLTNAGGGYSSLYFGNASDGSVIGQTNTGNFVISSLNSSDVTQVRYQALSINSSYDGGAASTTPAVNITSNGNVGIGTTNPGAYMLAVNGNVHARQVNVDITGWGDYVFKKDYPLMPLSAVKTYVDKNHHLPDIPSEK